MVENDRENKRLKIQPVITSMSGVQGPKFVEVSGLQLIYPYCNHKFRPPQGSVAQKQMHERAGDTIRPKVKNVPRSIFPKELKAFVRFYFLQLMIMLVQSIRPIMIGYPNR